MSKYVQIRILLALILVCSTQAFAVQTVGDWTIRGIVDGYFSASSPTAESPRPLPFVYSYDTQNGVALNQVLIVGTYSKDRVHGEIGFQTGTYPRANYAAEPTWAQYVYSAYLGYHVADLFWLDAGIFASHIGFESAIGKDNWQLTRSIMADNTPYFETGVRAVLDTPPQWTLGLYLLNGWQTIQETNGNKAVGAQLQYRPTDQWLLNYSSFFGNEKADSAPQTRVLHDFYVQYLPAPDWKFAALLDLGWEQAAGSESYDSWQGWAFLGRYQVSKPLALGGRVEYYRDPNQHLTTTFPGNSLDVWGVSGNVDYTLTDNVLWRVEAKYLVSRGRDLMAGTPSTRVFLGTTSLTYEF